MPVVFFSRTLSVSEHLGNLAVRVSALGLVQGGQLSGRIAFRDQPGSEVLVDVGLHFLELRQDWFAFSGCRPVSGVECRELRSGDMVVRAFAINRPLQLRLEREQRGSVFFHLGNAAIQFL